MRVKVGIAGTGSIFKGAHLPAYPSVPEAKLLAFYDIYPQKAEEAREIARNLYEREAKRAEEMGNLDKAKALREDMEDFKVVSSIEELCESVELVDICTPPNTHSKLSIEVLERGVNVMCEKPMALTYLDCLEVCKAVERTGRLYQHNENFIFDSLWYSLRKAVEGGIIGAPLLMILPAAHGGPEWASWFWRPEIAGGGALLDNGIHAITCAWFIIGLEMKPIMVEAVPPVGVRTVVKRRMLEGVYEEVKVEDKGHILIRFEEEKTRHWASALVEGSWYYQDIPQMLLIGSKGMVRIRFPWEEGGPSLKYVDARGNEVAIPIEGVNGFVGEIRNMVRCVLQGKRSISDERIGTESQAIVGAAYMSQGLGRAVSLAEFKEFALKVNDSEKLLRQQMEWIAK
ncbi:MAG: Gfo/Idh/MocA family protein [bacterium]